MAYILKSNQTVGLADVAARRAAAQAAGIQVISAPIGIPAALAALPMGTRIPCTFVPGSTKELTLEQDGKVLIFFTAEFMANVNGAPIQFSSILFEVVEKAVLVHSSQVLTGTRSERKGNADMTISIGAPVATAAAEQVMPPQMATAPTL